MTIHKPEQEEVHNRLGPIPAETQADIARAIVGNMKKVGYTGEFALVYEKEGGVYSMMTTMSPAKAREILRGTAAGITHNYQTVVTHLET